MIAQGSLVQSSPIAPPPVLARTLSGSGYGTSRPYAGGGTTAAPVPMVMSHPESNDAGIVDDVGSRLFKLKQLFDQGLISEEEYQQNRASILSAI